MRASASRSPRGGIPHQHLDQSLGHQDYRTTASDAKPRTDRTAVGCAPARCDDVDVIHACKSGLLVTRLALELGQIFVLRKGIFCPIRLSGFVRLPFHVEPLVRTEQRSRRRPHNSASRRPHQLGGGSRACLRSTTAPALAAQAQGRPRPARGRSPAAAARNVVGAKSGVRSQEACHLLTSSRLKRARKSCVPGLRLAAACLEACGALLGARISKAPARFLQCFHVPSFV